MKLGRETGKRTKYKIVTKKSRKNKKNHCRKYHTKPRRIMAILGITEQDRMTTEWTCVEQSTNNRMPKKI